MIISGTNHSAIAEIALNSSERSPRPANGKLLGQRTTDAIEVGSGQRLPNALIGTHGILSR